MDLTQVSRWTLVDILYLQNVVSELSWYIFCRFCGTWNFCSFNYFDQCICCLLLDMRAKSRSSNLLEQSHHIPVLLSDVGLLMIDSVTSRNRYPHMLYPCFTPDSTWNHSVSLLLVCTEHSFSQYMGFTTLISFVEFCSFSWSAITCLQCRTLSQSLCSTNGGCCSTIRFVRLCYGEGRSVTLYFVQPVLHTKICPLFLNPLDNNPPQDLGCCCHNMWNLLLSWSFMIIPFFESSETPTLIQTDENIPYKLFTAMSTSISNSSTEMLSILGVFPLFMSFNTSLISSLLMVSTLMSSSSCISFTSVRLTGSSRFNNFSECFSMVYWCYDLCWVLPRLPCCKMVLYTSSC